MTLQEIIESLDTLSVEDQTSLFDTLQKRLEKGTHSRRDQTKTQKGDTFWQGVLTFRERIEQEGIEFTDEDFADLRDRSPGREVNL